MTTNQPERRPIEGNDALSDLIHRRETEAQKIAQAHGRAKAWTGFYYVTPDDRALADLIVKAGLTLVDSARVQQTTVRAESAEAERDSLRERVEEFDALAREHAECSGCPTPWWLKQALARSGVHRMDDHVMPLSDGLCANCGEQTRSPDEWMAEKGTCALRGDSSWFREEYEKAKAFNESLPPHARLVVSRPVGPKKTNATAEERLTLVDKTMSAIEDEHIANASEKYCTEGSCRECNIIERVNLALAGEA